jgi:hypothetical protein
MNVAKQVFGQLEYTPEKRIVLKTINVEGIGI